MSDANDYESVYEDGTWKYKRKGNPGNPSTISPILKSDGWINGNAKTQPSHLAPSPGKLRFMSAREVMEMDSTGLEPLWSSFLYPKSIHILNSVAGVGKTTLCYNLAICGARAEDFANIPFEKPLNVLYADLETSEVLMGNKLRLISENNPPENLHLISSLNLIDDYDELEAFIKGNAINFLIVDTINEAFNTRDEQDNAEANRQFVFLKRLRDEAGCSILLVAHIGKGEQAHRVYATRGASARAASVDVVLNLTEVTDTEVCLAKEKDRIGGGKEKLYLRKAGEDSFEVVERNEDMEASLLIRAQRFILEKLDEGLTRTKEFIEVGKEAGYSKPSIERALSNLYHAGKIDRSQKGVYAKLAESSKPNNYFGDDLKDDGSNIPPENPSITSKYSIEGLMDSSCDPYDRPLTEEEVCELSRYWHELGEPCINLNSTQWADLDALLFGSDDYLVLKRSETTSTLKHLLEEWSNDQRAM